MIQFNLLPAVKLEYIKTQRIKRFVVSTSVIAAAASIAVFVVLVLTVDVWQKKTVSDYSSDIKALSQQLRETPDLNKVLTVQSQLGALGNLHQTKPAASRLFGYLSQVTPTQATISNITTDFTANTLSITGDAPSLDIVNTFVDGLKFTKYRVGSDGAETNAFSDVVLSSFGRTNEGASYTLTLSFDPLIFNNTNDVKLLVPNKVTTRSVIEQPAELFNQGSSQE
jgi:hypothetical protein